MSLACSHDAEPSEVGLCTHLAALGHEDRYGGFWWRSRGVGLDHDLLCDDCVIGEDHQVGDVDGVAVLSVCLACVARLEEAIGELMIGHCHTYEVGKRQLADHRLAKSAVVRVIRVSSAVLVAHQPLAAHAVDIGG